MSALVILAAIVAGIALLSILGSRQVTVIYPPLVGLLYRNGRFERELPPGRYAFFDPLKRTKILKVSLAELPTQIGELTVLSKDQFSFRIGLAPVLKVVEPRPFAESQPLVEENALSRYMPPAASHAALHPLVSAAALEVASSHTLQEILSNAQAVAEAVRARLLEAIPGASIERVLLTSINLPPETRKMFTDVERARMEGLASLERARSEQAALRVLANAARLVADNPALANLRLLQTIETSKGPTTIVVGSPAAANGLGVNGVSAPAPAPGG